MVTRNLYKVGGELHVLTTTTMKIVILVTVLICAVSANGELDKLSISILSYNKITVFLK